MVVFDSSIIVEALTNKKAILKLIECYSKKEQIAITIISKYEILRGTSEKNLSFVSAFLSQFIIYYFEDSAVAEVLEAYNKLKANGKMINELDIIISGIAAANNETLVTKDKDFLNFESTKIIVL